MGDGSLFIFFMALIFIPIFLYSIDRINKNQKETIALLREINASLVKSAGRD